LALVLLLIGDILSSVTVLQKPITADSAITHSKQKILALKGESHASLCILSCYDLTVLVPFSWMNATNFQHRNEAKSQISPK
jgi:hypothetical protein